MNFNNPEEFSSSPVSGGSVNSDDTGNQAFVTADEVDSSDSDDKDLVEDESTVTGVDNDDMTARSALSARSSGGSSTNSSGRLDAVLQQAARQAGIQGIDYDEHGDITMEMADDEVTNAFQPWVRKGQYVPQVVGHPSALQDQENVNPFSPEFRSRVQAQAKADGADETMDITQAAGSILYSCPKTHPPSEGSRRRSSVGRQRQSSGNRRRSSDASSMNNDETMELTTAIGGIQSDDVRYKSQQVVSFHHDNSDDKDEELIMELTTVVDGVLGKGVSKSETLPQQSRRESLESCSNDTAMDITFAAGNILSSITERTEPPEDQTMEMDVTQAVGVILPKALNISDKTLGKNLMDRKSGSEAGQCSLDPFYDGPSNGIAVTGSNGNSPVFRPSAVRASETGSPSAGGSAGRSNVPTAKKVRQSNTPKVESRQTTPLKNVSTPSKQVTPSVGPRPTTPGKTPPSKNVSLRTGSPKKLFEKELEDKVQPMKTSTESAIFKGIDKHGALTPQVILKPRRRRSSGLGADKEGLGSPRVTELLDRRGSIGQTAQSFMSHGKGSAGVRFEDPRIMEQEIEQERAEDERRQSGRGILQMEADSQDTDEQRDATTNLKGMIESLTPQKKKPKARKSLHVGAAKGLLGKRPAELDEDDDEDDTTLNRLRGREGSPVKKIRLPAPPSKNETTRRHVKSARLSLAETMGNARINTPSIGVSPVKGGSITTPHGQTRFKDAIDSSSAVKPVASFEQKLEAGKTLITQPPEGEDRIHLQDFLNMTSIRFMELTTTKRRLTVAPSMQESGMKEMSTGLGQPNPESEFEGSVVAGACTVPMLELYQHVCLVPPLTSNGIC